jgi:hypothetical protein
VLRISDLASFHLASLHIHISCLLISKLRFRIALRVGLLGARAFVFLGGSLGRLGLGGNIAILCAGLFGIVSGSLAFLDSLGLSCVGIVARAAVLSRLISTASLIDVGNADLAESLPAVVRKMSGKGTYHIEARTGSR